MDKAPVEPEQPKAPPRGAIAVTQILLVGCAIFVIVVAKTQLEGYYSCAYTPAGGSATPCNYLVALGSIAIAFNLFIGMGQCAFGIGSSSIMATLDVMLAFFLFFWWIAGGSYFTVSYWEAAGNGSPSGANGNWRMDSYRRAVYAVSWVAVGLSFLSLFLSVLSLDAANANEKKAAKEEERHKEQQQQISAMYNAPLPPGVYTSPPGTYAPPLPAGFTAPPAQTV